MWNPSTSFDGEIVASTSSTSMCGGSGSCTRIPWIVGSAFSSRMRPSTVSAVASAGYSTSTEWMPVSAQAFTLLRT